MKTSISLDPQPQLLARILLPLAEPGEAPVLHTTPGQGGLLCSLRWPGEGLLGFQGCGPPAATPSKIIAPSSPIMHGTAAHPLQPGLSQHFCCLRIIHAWWEASQL